MTIDCRAERITTWLRLPGMLGNEDTFTECEPWLDVPGEMVDVAVDGATVTECVTQLLDTAESTDGPIGVMGLSLGGIVALAAASRHPSAFTALIVMSTNALAPRPDQRSAWRQQASRTSVGDFSSVVEKSLPSLFATDSPGDRLLGTATAMAYQVGPARFLRQLSVQQSRHNLLDGLGSVNVPVLVLAGGRDRLCPVERHREIAAALPEGTVQVLPQAGHLLTLETPQDTAAAINAWWRSIARETTPEPASVTCL